MHKTNPEIHITFAIFLNPEIIDSYHRLLISDNFQSRTEIKSFVIEEIMKLLSMPSNKKNIRVCKNQYTEEEINTDNTL